MLLAVCAFFVSILAGLFLAMFNPGFGAVVSISVIGAVLIYLQQKNSR